MFDYAMKPSDKGWDWDDEDDHYDTKFNSFLGFLDSISGLTEFGMVLPKSMGEYTTDPLDALLRAVRSEGSTSSKWHDAEEGECHLQVWTQAG